MYMISRPEAVTVFIPTRQSEHIATYIVLPVHQSSESSEFSISYDPNPGAIFVLIIVIADRSCHLMPLAEYRESPMLCSAR